MFCKFCGQTLSPASVRCERCGRDVPATSDCGGFYQIMPDAAAKAGVVPVQPGSEEQIAAQNKRLQLPLILLAVLLVAALVLLAVLWGKVGALQSQLTDLEQEISELSDELDDHLDTEHAETVPNSDDDGGTDVPVQPIDPAAETTTPVEETTAPPEETTDPAAEPTDPVEETTDPAAETTAPPEETTDPVEDTTDPVEGSEPAENPDGSDTDKE